MQVLDLELDEIESAQLAQFARLNNLSLQEAAAVLIHERLDEWADSVVEELSPCQARH